MGMKGREERKGEALWAVALVCPEYLKGNERVNGMSPIEVSGGERVEILSTKGFLFPFSIKNITCNPSLLACSG